LNDSGKLVHLELRMKDGHIDGVDCLVEDSATIAQNMHLVSQKQNQKRLVITSLY